MAAVEDRLQEKLNEEWRQLRHPQEWIPAFTPLGGYETLDTERLKDDMDAQAWGYYRAGLIEAYGRALRELEKENGEDG